MCRSFRDFRAVFLLSAGQIKSSVLTKFNALSTLEKILTNFSKGRWKMPINGLLTYMQIYRGKNRFCLPQKSRKKCSLAPPLMGISPMTDFLARLRLQT